MVNNPSFPGMDLISFWGDILSGWFRKRRKFFKPNSTLFQQWVKLAYLYLEGKAKIWFEGYIYGVEYSIDWEEFLGAICNRFGNKANIVEEFNKLTQEGGIEEYIERFEELKSLIHSLNLLLLESYYISSFISGLKKDIKPMLKILKPMILMTTFDQAKWQQESNSVLARKNKFVSRLTTIVQSSRPIGNFQTKYTNP